ncbi:hypothetical protein BY996DRAFT_6411956 [Phakopsora pachyrhizi]|uniref:Uncharacterized protein n=1 Tax=Phakopsora pachyrhizi TaxID=170000 RepID=A0AAV0AIN0_PHAPC|nr:hypothetical protein BY996DRAFT_6411956 [Phakopsora pachyrhizi]CAH7668268.1 hypothetical protein PPACK8108_LOCUS2750 [Phakopsora pachyrhizi]
MQNSFFWMWKISHSICSKYGLKPNPMWDYQLGLKVGWICPNVRQSLGGCAIVDAKQGLNAPVQPWSSLFEDWQVKAKNGSSSSIEAGELARYGQLQPSAFLIKQGKIICIQTLQIFLNVPNWQGGEVKSGAASED